jgi:hypothetical protein
LRATDALVRKSAGIADWVKKDSEFRYAAAIDGAHHRRTRGVPCRTPSQAVKIKNIFPVESCHLTGLVQQPVQIVARFAITI